MRTTIVSVGGAFECIELCLSRCLYDSCGCCFSFAPSSLKPEAGLPFAVSFKSFEPSEVVSVSESFRDREARWGKISRVVIVSCPPAGVNLQALLGAP